MKIRFQKYQGTGNDFIIIDNRGGEEIDLSTEQVRKACDRKFGVGADGLMILNKVVGNDFEMVYYNADGALGTLCGNGSRCAIKYIVDSGVDKKVFLFTAADGVHEAKIDKSGIICVKMNDVDSIQHYHNDYIIDTGSPHFIRMEPGIEDLDVYKKGREIRYSDEFAKKGINVNFVERLDEPDKIFVRTYERGVENETLSCGTGVTAAALACYHNDSGFNEVEVRTLGGKLNVEFDRMSNGSFQNIWLCGPAEKVFNGVIEL